MPVTEGIPQYGFGDIELTEIKESPIQKRWGRPSALCLGPPRKKQVGKGRKAGWDEALLKLLGENAFSFSFFSN